MTINDLQEQMRKIKEQLGYSPAEKDDQGRYENRPPRKDEPHREQKNNPGQSQNDQTPNVGWLFYFDYFREVDFSKVGKEKPEKKKGKEKTPNQILLESKNQRLFNLSLDNYRPSQYALPHLNKEDTFDLTTTYPGLLVGSGYPHEIKSLGEVKLGFFFDHTSGLPIIPGSSVKGVCRSIFEPANSTDLVNYFLMLELEDGFMQPLKTKALSPDEVIDLKKEIFEGIDVIEERRKKNKENGCYLPATGKDVFHDAIIWKSEHPFGQDGGKTGKFLANDYITPHINRDNRKLDAFTDPTPLQFLKVLPKVNFRFQFDLKDGAILNKKEKMELFRRILLHLGIGAKTNVGYGQFQ